MSGLHEDEIGHFVDSLTPHQRVYLQRLLGESLAGMPQPEPQGRVQEADHPYMAAESSALLFTLLGHLRQFEANDTNSDIRPFSLAIPEPGHAVIKISPRILSWRGIWEAKSHDWVRGMRVGRLTVDVSRLSDVNSATVAWLVTLAQHMPDNRIWLRGASESMRHALDVLHLHKMLMCEPDPPPLPSAD